MLTQYSLKKLFIGGMFVLAFTTQSAFPFDYSDNNQGTVSTVETNETNETNSTGGDGPCNPVMAFLNMCGGGGGNTGGSSGSGGSSGGSSGSGGSKGGGSNPTGSGDAASPELETNVGVCNTDQLEPLDKDLKKLKDINCGGKDYEKAFKKNGGYIPKKAKEDPSSSTGIAFYSMDKPTLYLKQLRLLTHGDLKDEKVALPSSRGELMESIAKAARAETALVTDHFELEKNITKKAREKFRAITADTIEDYEKKERSKYDSFVSSFDPVKKAYKNSAKSVKMEYAHAINRLVHSDDYIFEPTEQIASIVKPSERNRFRFNSLMQIDKESAMMARAHREIQRRNELIRITIERAYAHASIFRRDIAKKEIDKMLQAVDRSVQ